jgi:hypothetical protein
LTDWTDPAEVAKVLALLPVNETQPVSPEELIERSVAVYNLFDIAAVARDGGITFEGSGVGVLDQPLLAALEILLARRFHGEAPGS